MSAGTTVQLQSVSCPSANLCLASGGDTTLLKSTDGGTTWTAKQINAPSSLINQVYCASESKCTALFNDPVLMTGGVLDSSDGGETWTQTESWDASRPPIDRISCVATGTCYGIADTGMVKRAGTDPHWHGTNPNLVPPPPPARYLVDVACPSEQLCIALGQPRAGDEAVIVRVTNDGGDAARVTNLGQDVQGTNLETVTCQNDKTCFAAGQDAVILRTDDGGATWSRVSWTPPSSQGAFGLKSISCPSAMVCVMVGGNFISGQCCGVIIRTSDGGSTWTNEKVDLPSLLWSVSCAAETSCVAVGDGGLIVTLSGGAAASLPTATAAAPSGDLISSAVMAGGVKGFNMPTGVTDTFPPNWSAIHTVVTSNQAPSGTKFRIVWIAVDVGAAASPNTKMTELSDTWEGSENHDYYFQPSSNLAEGTYKVDLYINDKLDRTLNFNIRKDASAPVLDLTPSAVGSCPPAPSHTVQNAIVQSVTTAKNSDSTTKEPVDPTSTFGPKDEIHAVAKITNAPNNTRFKAVWFATDVGDAAPCSYIVTSYQLTASGTNNLDFTLNRSAGLPIGKYRIEIYVDDQFAMEAEFTVQ